MSQAKCSQCGHDLDTEGSSSECRACHEKDLKQQHEQMLSQYDRKVSILIPLSIVLLFGVSIMVNATVLLFPLGLALLLGKMLNSEPVFAVMSFVSYGLLLAFIVLLFKFRNRSKFKKVVLYLSIFLMLNIVGCMTMGKFIDG